MDHLIEHGKAKAQATKAKRDRAQHKADKDAIKPLSKLKAEAQKEFNKYIRLRDYWEPCISCGKSKEEVEAKQAWKTGGCWDAGHFKSRGAKPQLRFNTFNVSKECKNCNAGSGKFSAKAETVGAQYRANLIEKIGLSKVEALECNNDIRRFDADYYKRIKVIFSKRARRLKSKLNID